MSTEINFAESKKDLIRDTKIALSNAYQQAFKDSKTISARRWPNSIYISDVLINVKVEAGVIEIINAITPQASNIATLKVPTKNSLAAFIEYSRSIKKAKERVLITENHLKRLAVLDESIDYLKELYHCLELASITVKKSKRFNKGNEGYFLEYCALCWRLVNKNMLFTYSHTKGYSQYYCIKHHPQKAGASYHSARDSLLRAVKDRGGENLLILKDFDKGKIKRNKMPYFLYNWTDSFAKKPSSIEIEKAFKNTNDWMAQAKAIIKLSSHYYPRAMEIVKEVNVEDFSSWKDWFLAIVNAFDSNEIKNWEAAKDDWSEKNALQRNQGYITGKHTILNIIHRFEAKKNISHLQQHRRPGPKQGQVKRNEALRKKIIKFAKEQKSEGKKVNAAKIARKLGGLSRERVNKLINELNLR